jgi:biopolymer transport protein ExbB
MSHWLSCSLKFVSYFLNEMFVMNRSFDIVRKLALLAIFAGLLLAGASSGSLLAQEEPAGPSAEPPPALSASPTADPPTKNVKPMDNFFILLVKGGIFMVPIFFMSVLAVAMSIERALHLRREKIVPPELVVALGELGSSPNGFDPRAAYRICQQYPCTASNVIRAMLLKIGRPHSEVEHAVTETCQREAEKLYSNVRWINLAVSVTPLIGLLGTVWGMIECFHVSSQLEAGSNRAQELAGGIYVALVTTLGGLMVAIPAAIVSHYYEGRIQALMFQVEELVLNLLPQVERFEGRVRFTRHQEETEVTKNGDGASAATRAATAAGS